MYYTSFRLLMARSPLGFSCVSRRCAIVSPMVSLHTNHCLLGFLQMAPIHFRDASVTPVHVGGCGLISLQCVSLSDRE